MIGYQLSKASHVTLKVYDLLGKEISTLVDEFKSAGKYQVQFSIHNIKLSSGIYFYTLHAENLVSSKKMILMK